MAVVKKMYAKHFAQGWDVGTLRDCWPFPVLGKGEGICPAMLCQFTLNGPRVNRGAPRAHSRDLAAPTQLCLLLLAPLHELPELLVLVREVRATDLQGTLELQVPLGQTPVGGQCHLPFQLQVLDLKEQDT